MDISKLKEAGLTDYEARAYLALLKFGAQTGREVAKNSGVPPTRVFDALKALVDRGLASLIKERPMLFKAIEPEIGLKTLFEKKREALRALEKEALATAKEVKRIKAKPRIHEKITVLLGYEQMYAQFIAQANAAKKQILVFSVGEPVPFSVKKAVKKAIDRGVDGRFIASKCDEENRHILKGHAKIGWQMRHYPTTQEYTFSVIDKTRCMINVRNPKIKEERISIFFEVPGLAQALAAYFEQIWKTARPIKF